MCQNACKTSQNPVKMRSKIQKTLQFEHNHIEKKVILMCLQKKVPPNGYFGNLTTSFLHNDRDIEGFVCKSDIFRSLDSRIAEIYFRIFAAFYVHSVPNAVV